jgi:HD superfamily phosphohydrolase
MHITDCLHGTINISEPVILDIINSPALQRLKDIDQAGFNEPFHPNTKHTRFEHSIGVYYLLHKFGASKEEQIAGLIHDVSHAVFSHCIDYALDAGSEKEQSHQDNIFSEFIRKTSIPSILKQYGLDSDYIFNETNFPFLETMLPDLCADRLDYSLRTAIIFKEINKKEALKLLTHIHIKNKQWIFDSAKTAKQYAEIFFIMNDKYYASLSGAVMHKMVGDLIRHALSKKYIIEKDLYTTDTNVLNKINPFLPKDKILMLFWKRLNRDIGYKEDKNNYDVRVFCKSRIVDPLCQNNGNISRLSEIDTAWAKILSEEKEPKEYYIKFDK